MDVDSVQFLSVFFFAKLFLFYFTFNPLMGTGNYNAISNNMKLVHCIAV